MSTLVMPRAIRVPAAWISPSLGGYALIGGLLTLLGWALDIRRLTDWSNNGISQMPNNALGVMAAGAAVVLLFFGLRRPAAVLGAVAGLIGAATLFQYLTGIDLGIDRLLVYRDWGQRGTLVPGRMGPPSSISLTILGLSIILSTDKRTRRLAVVGGLLTVAIAMLSVMGYLFGATTLYTIPKLTTIALQTATMLLALGLALVIAIPERQPMRTLLRDGASALLVKHALPAVILLPILLGWLSIRGQQAGLIDSAFGTALLVLVLMVMLTAQLWWSAAAVRVHETALREGRDRLSGILGSITDTFMTFDANWRFIFLNEQVEARLGKSRSELLGKNVWDVLPDTIGNEAYRQLHRAMSERVSVEYEVFYPQWQQWFAHRGYPTAEGGLAVYSRDITDRKLAEQTLLIRHEHARLLSDVSARLVLRSKDQKRETADELLQSVFADMARQLDVEYYFNFVVGDEPETLRLVSCQGLDAATQAAFGRIRFGEYLCGLIAQTRQPLVIEDLQNCPLENAGAMCAMCAMGARAYAGYPMLNDGRLIGTISFATARRLRFTGEELELIQAVADLLAAAVERDRLAASVREAEEKFHTLADNIPQLAWIADAGTDGQIHWFNKNWLDYAGATLEQMQGHGWHAVNHPDHAERVINKFAHHVREGLDWEDTFPLRGKDGQFRWFLSRMKVNRNESGEVVRIFGTNTDVSEQLQMADDLRRLTAELSEADRRKDEFLATLAHELRNPLAPVRNAVQLLHLKGPDIPELQWARDVIDRQMQGMTRLIDDLMDVSRISSNKLELRKERVELVKVVQGAVETSRPMIEQQGHELSVSLPAGPIILDADLTRLAQVFLNLLNNSAKYTEPGGRITLAAKRQGSDVVITVTDTGIGIPADKLPRIFEMFSQVEGSLSRSQGGLGIGLCLVKRLVEMHGGSVEAHSEGLGKGSEFVVRLPIVTERRNPLAPRPATVEPASTSALRILVVDDNRDAASSIGMLLKIMGNSVRTAHDGEEAVTAAGEFRPQVVLLDIGLPKMNGYDVARCIRREPWGKNIVLIAVTGWGQDEDKRKSEEAGFDRHMIKPVDPQTLMKMLAELSDVASNDTEAKLVDGQR